MRASLMSAAALALVAGVSVPASSATLVSCPLRGGGGDNVGLYGIVVPGFPGASVSRVTIHVSARSKGPYGLALTLRQGSFDGPVLGTSSATVTLTGNDEEMLPAVFDFTGVPVAVGETVALVLTKSSGPDGFSFFGTVTDAEACPVLETESFDPPLSTMRRKGVVISIEGEPSPVQLRTLTIPASASIHGQNGTFFHSDVWVVNRSAKSPATVTARYRCFQGQSCGSGTASFTLAPLESRLFTDAATALFSAPETAGPIELTYDAAQAPVSAVSRVYTPSLPSPTNGTEIPALPASRALGRSVLVGLAHGGAARTSGFRTNVGFYNPSPTSVFVNVSLFLGDGEYLGATGWSLAGHEAYQINDIFGYLGSGDVVTDNAYLVVGNEAFSDSAPVFAYATVIDNRSGDSVFIAPVADPIP